MAYDEGLAGRLRALLDDDPALAGHAVTEKKMFGGLAFLVGGHMAVAASGQGGLLVRVEPAATEDLLATTAAFPMEMRGRAMNGWLRVDDADVETDDQLATWVGRGTSYAASLPAK
ncbi:TfoX/Sxy family protein [Nocardioides sp. CPCC 206347]|jgi:TfoX/Sxy family transcriptional regulator of competence genes|uniref:TfoX/Sxy family protein n=1 Tax=unclassified Nocardioides TaxID=2615069 RepID=UPI00360B297C